MKVGISGRRAIEVVLYGDFNSVSAILAGRKREANRPQVVSGARVAGKKPNRAGRIRARSATTGSFCARVAEDGWLGIKPILPGTDFDTIGCILDVGRSQQSKCSADLRHGTVAPNTVRVRREREIPVGIVVP